MSEETALLVTFARAEESRAFCRRLQDSQRMRTRGPLVARGKIGSARVGVAHIGIGAAAAEAAMAQLLDHHSWWLVIGAGFAGGLDPKLGLGDSIMEEVLPSGPVRLTSVPSPVETAEAKRALHLETGAAAVDMETETLWRACKAAGLPLLAVRAISDPADTDLPVPFRFWFDLSRQRPRPLALLAYLARHPRRIPPFSRFVRAIPRLSMALAIAVEGCIGSAELT